LTSGNRPVCVGTMRSFNCFSIMGRVAKEIHFKVKGAPQEYVASRTQG
jgi:hypothetical protein